jgi:hypothetical protein
MLMHGRTEREKEFRSKKKREKRIGSADAYYLLPRRRLKPEKAAASGLTAA